MIANYRLTSSRKQENNQMPVMLSIVEDFPDYHCSSKSGVFFYESFITNKNIKFISNKTYDLKNSNGSFSDFWNSNIRNCPFQSSRGVCYKGSWASTKLQNGLLP
jgi:lipid-A-disaccharide synthase